MGDSTKVVLIEITCKIMGKFIGPTNTTAMGNFGGVARFNKYSSFAELSYTAPGGV